MPCPPESTKVDCISTVCHIVVTYHCILQGAIATFQIRWGDHVGVMDEESWLEVIKKSSYYKNAGGWCVLNHGGKEHKFRAAEWKEKLQDKAFKKMIVDILDDELIHKFESTGSNIVPDDIDD